MVVPTEAIEAWSKAEKIAATENASVSEIIVKALQDYVDCHGTGNPQVPLAPTLTAFDEYVQDRAKARLERVVGPAWADKNAQVRAIDKAVELARKIRHPPGEIMDLVKAARTRRKALEEESK